MSAYGFLAPLYDRLTEDIDYKAMADEYEERITQNGRKPEIVLDLACGTGRLTRLLARRGYQMIGVDASSEMLSEAVGQQESENHILYLQQPLTELDLYGTVDAAICTLDGLNYLPPEDLRKALSRVFLFLSPGGIFAFDLNTPEKLMSLDGEIFCDEREDLLCLWRCNFDEGEKACHYDFDIFTRRADLWTRQSETHVQYAYATAEMQTMLEQAGFKEITATERDKRTVFTALHPEG